MTLWNVVSALTSPKDVCRPIKFKQTALVSKAVLWDLFRQRKFAMKRFLGPVWRNIAHFLMNL